jgi:hypothetical protein
MGNRVEDLLQSDLELYKRLNYSVLCLPSDPDCREYLCSAIEIVHEYAPSVVFVAIPNEPKLDQFTRGLHIMHDKVYKAQ